MPRARKYSSVSTAIGAAPEHDELDRVEAELGADARADLLGQRGRVVDALAAQRALDLLPHARDRAPHGRPHLGQVLDDGARVGDRGDGARRSAQAAVYWLAQRSARCALGRKLVTRPPGVAGRTVEQPRSSVIRLWCVSCDALRRAGRAARVDQREEVVGLDGAPASARSGSPLGVRSSSSSSSSTRKVVLDEALDGGQELALGDQHAVAGVGEQVLDLLAGRRVVDGERRRRRGASPPCRRGGTRAG